MVAIKVKRDERDALFFVTFTCYKWLALFEETNLYDNIYKWFAYMESQGIKTAGYVIMRMAAPPNHLNCMIYLPADSKGLDIVIGNGKRFLAYEIVKRLKEQKDVETLELLENTSLPEKRKMEIFIMPFTLLLMPNCVYLKSLH